MKSLDNIAEDLFNKIRGRFPSVTIGDENGKITTDPITARFFDFDYKEGDRNVGKVSISITEDKLSVMYSNSFVENEDTITRQNWYNFLKELRIFAKKRLLQFDTRDITKSNLDKRDYKFLAQKGGDEMMSESKLYGTSKLSYQDIGNARLNIRHAQAINPELAASRTQHIEKIYVESADGERFMYPYKHLNGARAMARHVSEGGKPYDDFGKHITGLSEELANLKKFKTYMNRSSVMAESLAGYLDVVAERLETIKKTVSSLQKESYYKEAVEGFEAPMMEDVPEDVAENWIEQLTIKQFNEDLKDVFPYVYKLVSEASKAKEISPENLDEFDIMNPIDSVKKWHKGRMDKYDAKMKMLRQLAGDSPEAKEAEFACNVDPADCLIKFIKKNNLDPKGMLDQLDDSAEDEFEGAIDDLMGQFADKEKPQPKKPEVPVTEFILSLYDRETGEWPKGETAVLTAVEKDYGEQFINPAKAFIERVKETYDTHQMEANPQQMEVEVEDEVDNSAFDDMRALAGLR
jgi:hypothetical protein